MTKVREISWPDEFSDLKRIEESMTCGICYDYMETTVMTPCSHNYCSLCIRKYLHYKAQCPACFNVFYEKDLYINRVMDVFIQHYVSVREKLISLIENRTVYNTVIQQKSDPTSTPPSKPVRNFFPKSPKVQEVKPSDPKTPSTSSFFASTSKNDASYPVTPSTSLSFTTTSISDASSPSTSRSQKCIPSIAKIFSTPKRKETAVSQSVVANVKSVSCPVCSVDISQNHINVHLDACLKRERSQKVAEVKRVTSKRPPLPKLVLRVMKDAELRKKIKELGLPTHGDRKTLETRFTRYSTIYNAECDKMDPRPIPDLIRQCEMEEKQERKMDCFLVSVAPTRLQIEKNAHEEKIEEAQKTYREANKSSFDKLVEEVRNRRKKEQKEKTEEATSSTSEPGPSTSTTEPFLENSPDNEEQKSLNPVIKTVLNDSDSDESYYPLQHYVNINDSSASNSTAGSPMKRPRMSIKSNSKAKGSLSPQKIFNNPYEASTDESADENIENSPKEKKVLNRSRLKLARKSISVKAASSNSSSNSHLVKNDKEIQARNLCNSIIQDFSFGGPSDDSSNEFVNNLKGGEETKLVLKNSNIPGHLALQKKTDNNCDIKVPEKQTNRSVLADVLNNSNDDFLFDNINYDSSGFVDTSIVEATDTKRKEIDEISKTPQDLDPSKIENGINSANENSQPISPVRRPVRKRNKPSRYADGQMIKEDLADEETSNLSPEDLLESPDSLRNLTSSDGSLKRRRGKSRLNSTDQAMIDAQNPPKRPVRRRQAASERN